MQHFNMALDATVSQANKLLSEKGISEQGHWVMRYVDDILIGFEQEEGHEEGVRCIFSVLKSHGWTMINRKSQWMQEQIAVLVQ